MPAPGTEYFLNIRVSRSDEWNYVPEDHIYASVQFKLPAEGKPVVAKRDNLAVLQTKTVDKKLEVSGVDMKIVFNLVSGKLESFNYKGKELIKKARNLISGDHLQIMIMDMIWINCWEYGKRRGKNCCYKS